MQLDTPFTLAEAADWLGCTFRGPAEHRITGLNEIHRVQPGDLTFVDVPKYYDKALHSAATTILIDQAVEVPLGKGLLISPQPFADFNRLGSRFRPQPQVAQAGQPQLGAGATLGEGVVCGEDVEIGAGTQIGHHVVIGSHVRIGANCTIYPHVTLNDHSHLGDHVCVNAGTVIGSEAFYFKSLPDRKEKFLSIGRTLIGDHVDIGANCSIDRGVTADTVIGPYTKLDNLVQIGHDTLIGARCILAGQVGIAGVTVIEDDVILWGQVGISKDLTIGRGAVIGAKSGVGKSLLGGQTYAGIHAVEIRQALREMAAVRRLPGFMARIERWWKQTARREPDA